MRDTLKLTSTSVRKIESLSLTYDWVPHSSSDFVHYFCARVRTVFFLTYGDFCRSVFLPFPLVARLLLRGIDDELRSLERDRIRLAPFSSSWD
jgi:hypothetical protein